MSSPLLEEARSAREGAAVVDRTGRGVLVARGADRLTFLNNMLSQATKDLAPGQGCRAELLDDRGHVVADFRVHVRGNGDVLLDCDDRAIAAKARTSLEKFIIMDDVTLEDVSEATAVLTAVGPGAPDFLRKAGVASVPSGAYASAESEHGLVVASRWTKHGDFDLYVAADKRDAVKAALVSAGAKEISRETFEALRIEAGVATQLAELDDVLALEGRLAPEAISFTKGCYLGQEVMARIDARGHVNRTLVGLALEGTAPAARGATLRAAEKDVGRITSSVLSPASGKPIALAYLRREQATPGTKIAVVDGGAERGATVVDLPFR